jgi:hypothetical protein
LHFLQTAVSKKCNNETRSWEDGLDVKGVILQTLLDPVDLRIQKLVFAFGQNYNFVRFDRNNPVERLRDGGNVVL